MIRHLDFKPSNQDIGHLQLDGRHNIFEDVQVARESDAGSTVFTRYADAWNKISGYVFFTDTNGSHSSQFLG